MTINISDNRLSVNSIYSRWSVSRSSGRGGAGSRVPQGGGVRCEVQPGRVLRGDQTRRAARASRQAAPSGQGSRRLPAHHADTRLRNYLLYIFN